MPTEQEIIDAKFEAYKKRYPHAGTGKDKTKSYNNGWDDAVRFLTQGSIGVKAISKGVRYIGKFDGSCEMNPGGDMGIGCFLAEVDNGKHKKIFEHSEQLFAEDFNGVTSNNIAECLALDKLLAFMLSEGMQKAPITIMGDSQVIIRSAGNDKPNKGLFAPYMADMKKSLRLFTNLKLQWISRDYNTEADLLSKIR